MRSKNGAFWRRIRPDWAYFETAESLQDDIGGEAVCEARTWQNSRFLRCEAHVVYLFRSDGCRCNGLERGVGRSVTFMRQLVTGCTIAVRIGQGPDERNGLRSGQPAFPILGAVSKRSGRKRCGNSFRGLSSFGNNGPGRYEPRKLAHRALRRTGPRTVSLSICERVCGEVRNTRVPGAIFRSGSSRYAERLP